MPVTATVAAPAPAAGAEHGVVPLLELRGLRVEFPAAIGPAHIALRDLDLAVAPGEILGLVGESGAGKTTLARSIMNLPPVPGRITAGEIWFGGRDLRRLPEERLRRLRGRELSMIVPNPRGELNPLLRVGEQIATLARVHLAIGGREARAKALAILKAVQIPDPARRMRAYPHELSGGMAQRVVIAMALVCSPRFVISDDATSGLDVTVQAQILDLMGTLARTTGSAMLFITRDVGITAHFCDRVAIIYAGEIMEIAPRDGLFLAPRHPYTVMLLAAFSHQPRLRRQWTLPDVRRRAPAGGLGCSYAGRCPLAQPVCRAVRPPLAPLATGHLVRCHFPVSRP
jgi:oligopeptide/dipeptide ABC transporter ATP-binding protein